MRPSFINLRFRDDRQTNDSTVSDNESEEKRAKTIDLTGQLFRNEVNQDNLKRNPDQHQKDYWRTRDGLILTSLQGKGCDRYQRSGQSLNTYG